MELKSTNQPIANQPKGRNQSKGEGSCQWVLGKCDNEEYKKARIEEAEEKQ